MVRRILGLIHVEDLEGIADADIRTACEIKILLIARTMILTGVLAPNSSWRALVTAQAGRKLVAGSKAPRPKTVCADCGATRAGHPATVRKILEYVGEPTIAPAIAPARAPPLEMKIAQQLAALEAVFQPIPDLEFDQTLRL